LSVRSDSRIQGAVILNAANHFAQTSAKWTLLPLLLVHQLHMSPAGLGTVYAAMSFFDMLTAQPVAAFADTFGHKNIMAPSALAMAAGVAVLAASATLAAAVPGLVLWSVGHSLIGSSPTAYTCSITSAKQRSAGVAVIRTTGRKPHQRIE
jgi:predicted MFS family arabinose efflux permease